MKSEKASNASVTSLKSNVVLNTIFRVISIIAPFITAPYLSRVLMSDGIGVYSYTQSLVTYFTMFAALGTVSYGTREIARKRDSKEDRSKTFWEIELISIICSAIALVIWIGLSLIYSEYKIFLLIFSFCILATCLDISWFYAGLEKYKYTISINLLFKVLSVVLIFVLIKNADDLWKFILIYSGSLFAGNLSMWLFLPKFICKTQIDKHSLKHHLKETLVYFVPTIAASLYTILDKTLIGALIQGNTAVNIDGKEVIKKTSEIESGYYEQATKIIDMVKAVAFIGINTVMCSRISYLYKKSDETNIKQLTIKTFEITLFLSIGAMFGLLGISQVFVPTFFGDGYEKTITILQILSVLVPIICISGVLGSTYYTPVGKRKQSSYFLLAGAGINLLLSAPLIIFFNSIGAAIASLIAETLIMVLYIVYCKRAITLKELVFVLWKKIVAGSLMLGLLFIFNSFIRPKISSSVLYIIIAVLSGGLLYSVILFLLGDKSLKIVLPFTKKLFRKNQQMCKAVYPYKEIDTDETVSLSECQKYLVRLLDKFSMFCQDYKIDFFLLWGSLLGAKRNNKMIPWDDDIDIGVTDETFARLLTNANHLSNYGINYLHYTKNSKMYSNEIRLFLPGFYKIQETNFKQYMTPVCIDVFVANKINSDINYGQKTKCELKIKRTINILVKKEAIWKSQTTLKYLLRSIQKVFLSIHSTKRLHKRLERLCKELYNGSGDYQYCFPETLHNKKSWLKTYDKKSFEKLENILFENVYVSIPSSSEEILRINYGDWKTPVDRTSGKVFQELFIYRKSEKNLY